MKVSEAREELLSIGELQPTNRFVKTGKGEYGENDLFVNANAADLYSIVKRTLTDDTDAILKLLDDRIHEVRMLGNLLIVKLYGSKATSEEQS